MIKFFSLLFLLLCVLSLQVTNALKKANLRGSDAIFDQSTLDQLDGCKDKFGSVGDCDKHEEYNTEKKYVNGDKVAKDGYLFELISDKYSQAPDISSNFCKHIQECLIRNVDWLVLGSCEIRMVTGDNVDKSGSKQVLDQVDI